MNMTVLILAAIACYLFYRHVLKPGNGNGNGNGGNGGGFTPDNPSPAGELPNPRCPRHLPPSNFDIARVKVKAEEFKTLIDNSAHTFGINAKLITAIIAIESMFDPNVRGGSGEYGLMQIMLVTAKDMGFTGNWNLLLDPQINIDFGTKYLKYQFNRYNGDEKFTIAAYNAGSARFLGKCPECGSENDLIYTGEIYKCLNCKKTWTYMPIKYTGLINHDYFCKVWQLYQKL